MSPVTQRLRREPSPLADRCSLLSPRRASRRRSLNRVAHAPLAPLPGRSCAHTFSRVPARAAAPAGSRPFARPSPAGGAVWVHERAARIERRHAYVPVARVGETSLRRFQGRFHLRSCRAKRGCRRLAWALCTLERICFTALRGRESILPDEEISINNVSRGWSGSPASGLCR